MLLFAILSIILPVAYIAAGLVFWKHTPKDINGIGGWKTTRARKSRETWEYANSHGGKDIFVLGVILFAVSIGLSVLFGIFELFGLEWISIFVAVIQAGLLGVVILHIENELEIKFGKS